MEIRNDLGAIRDSKLNNGPELTVDRQGMDSLVAGATSGAVRRCAP